MSLESKIVALYKQDRTIEDIVSISDSYKREVIRILSKHGLHSQVVNSSYSDEQTAEIVQLYKSDHSIDHIATQIGRPHRSIINKLVHEGVYKKKEEPKKHSLSKAEIVTQFKFIGIELPASVQRMKNKNLITILQALKEKMNDNSSMSV